MKIPIGRLKAGDRIPGVHPETRAELEYTVTAVRKQGNFYVVTASAPGVPEHEYKYHRMNSVEISG